MGQRLETGRRQGQVIRVGRKAKVISEDNNLLCCALPPLQDEALKKLLID